MRFTSLGAAFLLLASSLNTDAQLVAKRRVVTGASGGTPVTLVQFTAGSTPDTAFGTNNTSGNKIVVVVIFAVITGSATLSSVTDTAGNTYTVKASSLASVVGTHYAHMYTQVATADAIASGANTVSAHFSTSVDVGVANIYEVTAGTDDQFGPATGNSATPTSASVTTGAANTYAIASGVLDNGFGFGSGWFTAGSGWTIGYESGGGNENGYTEHRTVSGSGTSIQGTITSGFPGTTGPWAATVYTVKP